MRVSLNQGAIERKVVNGKEENVNIYIGNYLQEYISIGKKYFSVNDWERLKAEEIIEIQKGSTHFENFVLNNIEKIENSKRLIHYKRVKSFITSRSKKYIEKTDYDKIKVVLKDFALRDVDGSEQTNNRKKKSNLKENGRDLTDYINDFALIVIYAKEMCFENLVHYEELKNAIDEKQKIRIKNFYAQLQNSDGVDVEKIIFECNGTKNLEINSRVLVKMMLYNFAENYYTLIERLDKDNWENEIGHLEEKIKSGRDKDLNTPYFKSIENVYLDFVSEYIFTEKASKRENYLLLGRLFTITGLEKYDEENREQEGYIDEANFYHLKFTKRSDK